MGYQIVGLKICVSRVHGTFSRVGNVPYFAHKLYEGPSYETYLIYLSFLSWMQPLTFQVVVVVHICTALTLLAYWRRVLDRSGSFSAFFIGLVVGIFGSLIWLAVLLIFLICSFAVTKFKYEYKRKRQLQEGVKGERGLKNVLANGIIPVLIAFYSSYATGSEQFATILFLTAISVAAADTLASEIGTLSDRTYLITNLRERVATGTDGGVSWLGTGAAMGGALFVSVVGWAMVNVFSGALNPYMMLIPFSLGFLGCQVDSVLGATLEQRCYLTKGLVNLISIAIGVIMGVMIWIRFY